MLEREKGVTHCAHFLVCIKLWTNQEEHQETAWLNRADFAPIWRRDQPEPVHGPAAAT